MSARGERAQSAARRTVLLAEDDPDLLRFAEVTLRLGGYRVLAAADGESALALVRRARPDVVLLDLRLPGLDGWELLERLRSDAALERVPVVVVTASADPSERERASAARVVEFLVKPLSADTLLAAVERALSESEPTPRS
jgi:CheY-like chemotaxis protein